MICRLSYIMGRESSLCRVVMPWALFVHGNFIIDSERRLIKVSNFEGAKLKQYNFLGVVGR